MGPRKGNARKEFEEGYDSSERKYGPYVAPPKPATLDIIEDETAEPIERTVQPPPSWPSAIDEAAYHGLAGTIVKAIAPHTEADPVGVLGSFLAVFAALAGRNWRLHQGGWQRPILIITLVGETSLARKGTAYDAVKEVFDLVDGSWGRIIIVGLGSGEAMFTWLRQHESDPRALVHEHELSRLLSAMSRDNSTLSPMIRSAFDGSPIGHHVVDRKRSGQVFDYHLGVLANVTSNDLAAKLTSTEAANGFGNRFLWLAVRRSQKLAFTEPLDRYVSPFIGPLREALKFAEKGGTLTWSPAARRSWEAYYVHHERPPGLLGALTARSEPYVARLAMIYALLDASNVIEVEHLAAGEALVSYAERSAGYVFGGQTGDKYANFLLRLLEDESPLSWWETSRKLSLSGPDMDRTVTLLERYGLVEVVKVRLSGSTKPRREIVLVDRKNVKNAGTRGI